MGDKHLGDRGLQRFSARQVEGQPVGRQGCWQRRRPENVYDDTIPLLSEGKPTDIGIFLD